MFFYTILNFGSVSISILQGTGFKNFLTTVKNCGTANISLDHSNFAYFL